MNAVYVLGFLCLVSVVASHHGDGSYSHNYGGHYGNYGHHGHGPFRNINMRECFDFPKYTEAAARQPGCEDLKQNTTGSTTGERGRRGRFNFGRMTHFQDCLNQGFNLRNADNTTNVAGMESLIRFTAQPGKADQLATAFKTCAENKESFPRDQRRTIYECYGKAVAGICPRTQATTQAPAPGTG